MRILLKRAQGQCSTVRRKDLVIPQPHNKAFSTYIVSENGERHKEFRQAFDSVRRKGDVITRCNPSS